MKYVDEYRDADAARRLAAAIARATTRPWNIMEVCGGQTHAIVRFALDEMLPPQIALIHGPGCPVCVTPLEMIDKAVAIAARREMIFCSFGDMLRVPGSTKDLFAVKSEGGDVRIVYSPMEAVALAQRHPDRQVVFFAVGFETTAPANAMAVAQAARLGLKNFSALVSHVLVPPAIAAVLQSPSNRVQGFLAAGHVCAITGMDEYRPIAQRFRVPIVVTGFEPLDILQGVLLCVEQLEVRLRGGRQPIRPLRSPRREPGGDAEGPRGVRAGGAEVARASARFPPAGWPCARRIASSTPSGGLASRGSSPRSRRSASPAKCCRGIASRTTARPSAFPARRNGRWARRWSRPKGPAPPITATGAHAGSCEQGLGHGDRGLSHRHDRELGPAPCPLPLRATTPRCNWPTAAAGD